MSYIVIGKSFECRNIIKIFADGLESLALRNREKRLLYRLLKCGSTGCLFLEISRQPEITIAKNCRGKVF